MTATIPPPVVEIPKVFRDLVTGRSGDLCEVCGKETATKFHIRKSIKDGGEPTPANLLHVCSACAIRLLLYRIGYDGLGWVLTADEDPTLKPVQLQHGPTGDDLLLDDAGDYDYAYPYWVRERQAS